MCVVTVEPDVLKSDAGTTTPDLNIATMRRFLIRKRLITMAGHCKAFRLLNGGKSVFLARTTEPAKVDRYTMPEKLLFFVSHAPCGAQMA